MLEEALEDALEDASAGAPAGVPEGVEVGGWARGPEFFLSFTRVFFYSRLTKLVY